MDAVVSAGHVHVLQALDPKPHQGAHVNIKVIFFYLCSRSNQLLAVFN
jgi:hypothetical protein